jgi:hypothetical protein
MKLAGLPNSIQRSLNAQIGLKYAMIKSNIQQLPQSATKKTVISLNMHLSFE